MGEDLEPETLSAKIGGLQLALALVIESLDGAAKVRLRERLEPIARRLAAERPRGGEPWRDADWREVALAMQALTEGLEGAPLTE